MMAVTTLGALADGGVLAIGDGYRTKGSEYDDAGIPILRVADVLEGKVAPSFKDRVSLSRLSQIGPKQSRPGDVIVTTKGTVGRVALIPESLPSHVYSPQLCYLRVEDSTHVDHRWLYSWARSPQFQRQTGSVKDQTDMAPYVSLGDLRRFRIQLPPLDEQRRIAEVLGALDNLIDAHERLQSDLDELARAMFLRAWDGDTWTTVGELGEVIMGQSPPGDTYSENPVGVPFHQGVRDFGARFPTSRVYCSAPTRIAEAGDILIAVRAPVGEINVAPERLAIGRGLAALRATRPSTALQAIRAFESTWSAHQGTGTVFSSVNGKDLRAAKVPLVDDEHVEAALSNLDHAYAELGRERAEIRRTRDELLPLLMSGAVRVRPEEVAA